MTMPRIEFFARIIANVSPIGDSERIIIVPEKNYSGEQPKIGKMCRVVIQQVEE